MHRVYINAEQLNKIQNLIKDLDYLIGISISI